MTRSTLHRCLRAVAPGCLLVGLMTASILAAAEPGVMSASPAWFRQAAAYAPLPRYPGPSVHAHIEGVVVVSLAVRDKGTVEGLQVLQSPDKATADSVTETLGRWRFTELEKRLAGGMRKGRLIF